MQQINTQTIPPPLPLSPISSTTPKMKQRLANQNIFVPEKKKVYLCFQVIVIPIRPTPQAGR